MPMSVIQTCLAIIGIYVKNLNSQNGSGSWSIAPNILFNYGTGYKK